MSIPPSVPPALDASSDALRQYLADGARRELAALRAALDARLAALEDALAHPDQHASLEDLVIDLARTVSSEAESAAVRACLEAQLQAEDRTAEAIAGAQTAVEVARTISDALRLDLEQTRGSFEAEREAAGAADHELREAASALEKARAASAALEGDIQQARAALQTEHEVSVGLRHDLEDARRAVEGERAKGAAQEAEVGQERAARAQLAEALAALQRELAAAQEAKATRRTKSDANRSSLEALERRCADLDRACREANARAEGAEGGRVSIAAEIQAAREAAAAAQGDTDARLNAIEAERARIERAWKDAEARAESVIQERDGLAGQLDVSRQTASEARAAVEARLETSETGRDNAERSWYEAEARADAALHERDRLAAELEAVRQAASTAQLAFDSRLAAIDTQLAHLERASTDADARARDAVSSRDALQAELEAVRQGSPADAEHETRLEVADERIRALELQLFERDREARDRDIELSALLEDPPPAPAKPIRRANRYTFDAQFGVQIDDVTGVLVDLSISGAQVIWPHELPMNRIVTVSLPSDETPVSAEGRIAWTQIERGAKRQAPRFRTGIEFTRVGEVDVEAFIIRYAKS